MPADQQASYSFRSANTTQTLNELLPQLSALGISRLADISHMDASFGVQVFSAVRPRGDLLQATAGKALDADGAKVSAIMEAAELYCMENPVKPVTTASLNTLKAAGYDLLEPGVLYPDPDRYFSPDYQIKWIVADQLQDGSQIYIPEACVHLSTPAICTPTTNGVAAGRSLSEASLHGLFECIERDAASRLVNQNRLYLRERTQAIDLATLPTGKTKDLVQRIQETGLQVYIFRLPALFSIPTYWAFLFDPDPFSSGSTLNSGLKTHPDPEAALCGAITEAVQSRLTFVQGAREDTASHRRKSVLEVLESNVIRYLTETKASMDWSRQDIPTTPRLDADPYFHDLLLRMSRAGYGPIIRVSLSHKEHSFKVVKIVTPKLTYHKNLF
jgi:ribosomal protein S12 methylthiotransferase accessory factor